MEFQLLMLQALKDLGLDRGLLTTTEFISLGEGIASRVSVTRMSAQGLTIRPNKYSGSFCLYEVVFVRPKP